MTLLLYTKRNNNNKKETSPKTLKLILYNLKVINDANKTRLTFYDYTAIFHKNSIYSSI